jgi:hypothetical protein
MPKSKRKSYQIDPLLILEAPQSASFISIPNNGTFKDCEWCFQFDDNEPYVFASTKQFYEGKYAKITFTLTNQTNTNLSFKDTKTGKEFKIFAREKYEN